MDKLDITPALIAQVIGEVAPLVTQETGWDLAIATLSHRVIPKDAAFEQVVLARLQELGAPRELVETSGLISRLIEYVVEGNVLAAYQPGANELVVVRENVDESNLDGVRVIVAHELVHRGQHLHHRPLFDQMDAAMRNALKALTSSPPDFSALDNLEQAQATMTMIESHASYVHHLILQRYYPDARIEWHFNLATILMHLVGGAKISQYSDGVPVIAGAGSNGQVDALYRELYSPLKTEM